MVVPRQTKCFSMAPDIPRVTERRHKVRTRRHRLGSPLDVWWLPIHKSTNTHTQRHAGTWTQRHIDTESSRYWKNNMILNARWRLFYKSCSSKPKTRQETMRFQWSHAIFRVRVVQLISGGIKKRCVFGCQIIVFVWGLHEQNKTI